MQDKQETRRQKAEPNTNPYYTRNPNMNQKSNIKPEHKRPTACNTTRIKQTTTTTTQDGLTGFETASKKLRVPKQIEGRTQAKPQEKPNS